MPQIIAPSQQHVLFVPLDQLAAKLLFPVYHQTVQTVGLNTEVESYPSRNPGPGESIISLTPCMKAQPDQRDLACGVPLDLCGHFEKFTAGPANLPRSGHFNLPNYIRAKPKES